MSQAQDTPLLRLVDLPQVLGLPQVLVLGGSEVSAAPVTVPLDLRQAARQALAINPDVEGADARADAARYQHEAAQAAFRPRAELRLAAGRGRLDSVQPSSLLDREDHNLVLRQSIVDEVARHEIERQAQGAEAARAWHDWFRAQALQETGNAILALLTAELGLRVAQAQEQELLNLAAAVTDDGSPQSGADRDRIAARLANLRSQVADSRSAVQASARNLERLTGVRPAALDVGTLAAAPVDLDESTSLAQVRQRSDELRARRLEADAVAAEVRSRAGRHWPRLELELGHYRNRNLGGLPGQVNDTRGFAVLTWPLLSGGADVANQRAAAARLIDAQARLRAAERRLVQEVETIYSTLSANTERLEAVRAELAGNQRLVLTLKRQPYGPGTSITDVLDAYQREAQSRLDLAQVLAARTQLSWRLAQLKGDLGQVFGADR